MNVEPDFRITYMIECISLANGRLVLAAMNHKIPPQITDEIFRTCL